MIKGAVDPVSMKSTEKILDQMKNSVCKIKIGNVSATGFFAATFGVGIYSNIDIISTMCNLMARGAAISMFAVILVLPTLLLLLDKLIIHTTIMKKTSKATAKTEVK